MPLTHNPPFYMYSFLTAFLQLVFQPLMSTQTGFTIGAWRQVGSTTDHLSSCCLIQCTEDRSTKRAELAGVITNRGLKNWVLQIGRARLFYPLPGPWCTLDRKERDRNIWCGVKKFLVVILGEKNTIWKESYIVRKTIRLKNQNFSWKNFASLDTPPPPPFSSHTPRCFVFMVTKVPLKSYHIKAGSISTRF